MIPADEDDSDAGVQWAWNLTHRYVGAGPVGKFRIFDLPSRIGSPEEYKGCCNRPHEELAWISSSTSHPPG